MRLTVIWVRLGGTLLLPAPALAILLVGLGVASQVPRVVHHQGEVLIVVNARRDVGIVFHELLQTHARVTLGPILQAVVGLEGLQELHEDLVLGLLALDDIRVLLGVVRVLDIFQLQVPIAVLVNAPECLLHECASVIRKFASDRHEELIDVEAAVPIRVKEVKYQRHVLFVDAHFEIAASLRKLVLAYALAAIVVHDCEQLLDTDDAPGSPRLYLVAE